MRNKLLLAVIFLLCATVACALDCRAVAQPSNRGLFITPLREYVSVQAGQTKNGTLTIANITDKPVTVTLSVEQFSVADYTYDYTFTQPKDDWIKFQTTQVQLQPNKSQTIVYTVAASALATPGGHYFTLLATTSLEGSITSKVRAATVLYVTVDGQLQRTGTIQKDTIPWISFGGDIPFALDIRNTGNTHFFVHASGKLGGWTTKPAMPEVTHILLPGTIRTASSSIPAPLLPGVYAATYGYKTDDGTVMTKSKPVVYLPLWALAIPLGAVWLFVMLRRRRHLKKRATDSSPRPYK